jgi:thiosulfate/3-mercaptopyruvate sulfurtransferase
MGINHSPIAAPGTIPGATNMPISWLTAPDGRFHSKAALQNITGALGLDADAPVVTFCTTGQMASLDWFVTHELLGNTQARMYDGSMTDWTADASRPVERKVVMP